MQILPDGPAKAPSRNSEPHSEKTERGIRWMRQVFRENLICQEKRADCD